MVSLHVCQQEHETETSIVQKAVSAERHWKGPWPLFFLHLKVKVPLRPVAYDWLLLLSLVIKNVRSSFIFHNLPGCGAILGTIFKGIALWEETVDPCVFSLQLRKQTLHFLIKQEYKWSFLLLMHKSWASCSNMYSRALACCLDRNHPFNTLEAECPRYLFYQLLAIWWSANQGWRKRV